MEGIDDPAAANLGLWFTAGFLSILNRRFSILRRGLGLLAHTRDGGHSSDHDHWDRTFTAGFLHACAEMIRHDRTDAVLFELTLLLVQKLLDKNEEEMAQVVEAEVLWPSLMLEDVYRRPPLKHDRVDQALTILAPDLKSLKQLCKEILHHIDHVVSRRAH